MKSIREFFVLFLQHFCKSEIILKKNRTKIFPLLSNFPRLTPAAACGSYFTHTSLSFRRWGLGQGLCHLNLWFCSSSKPSTDGRWLSSSLRNSSLNSLDSPTVKSTSSFSCSDQNPRGHLRFLLGLPCQNPHLPPMRVTQQRGDFDHKSLGQLLGWVGPGVSCASGWLRRKKENFTSQTPSEPPGSGARLPDDSAGPVSLESATLAGNCPCCNRHTQLTPRKSDHHSTRFLI